MRVTYAAWRKGGRCPGASTAARCREEFCRGIAPAILVVALHRIGAMRVECVEAAQVECVGLRGCKAWWFGVIVGRPRSQGRRGSEVWKSESRKAGLNCRWILMDVHTSEPGNLTPLRQAHNLRHEHCRFRQSCPLQLPSQPFRAVSCSACSVEP